MEEQNEIQKKLLVEKFGQHIETRDRIAPIAARIYATLLLEEKGLTFEELVKFLQASKSTISTNLRELTKTGRITSFTKPGDRKKYHIISGRGIEEAIKNDIESYKVELQLLNEIIQFKIDSNLDFDQDEKIFGVLSMSSYVDYLNNLIKLMERLRTDLQNSTKTLEKE